MPVLAVGASAGLGSSVAAQVRHHPTHVRPAAVPDSGHWIHEEHPREMTDMLPHFLGRHR
jgi:pimeloyl-ACP methyl ester carboxylesterase